MSIVTVDSSPTTEATRAPTGDEAERSQEDRSGRLRNAGLVGGALLFLIMVLSPAPDGLSAEGWRTAAVAALMSVWWMTEALPIAATAMLPLVLFPLLQVETIAATAAPYAEPMIFLFLGGFLIALAMQRWGLHRRIALNIIRAVGMQPRSIIAGFMLSAAFLSMWVSNTATTMMMLPIGLSVMELANTSEGIGTAPRPSANFALCLMLGIAYASSVGGIGTLVGTPANPLMAAFLRENFGIEIGFGQWMLVGLPVVLIGLPIIHVVLTHIVFPVRKTALPGGRKFIDGELARMGPLSRPELMVAAVFSLVALLWIFRPLLAGRLSGLSDTGIAIFGALLLFVVPIDGRWRVFLLDWKYAEQLPWGVLILFGGGLTLAGAIARTGLSEWLGGLLAGIGGWPFLLVVFAVTTVIILLTELTSNSATAAAFLPIMISVAIAIGENPLLLAVPVTMATSCAFMLPVATPPNAIVYSSGVMSIPQMARAGLVLNVLFALLITMLTASVVRMVFGVDFGAS